MTPLGFLYKQPAREGLSPFKVYTAGASFGATRGNDMLSLGWQGAYLYSNLKFNNNKGKAIMHGIHLGPVARFGSDRLFINALVDVSKSLYSATRRIKHEETTGFSVDEKLKSKNGSWNVLAGLSVGSKIYLSREHNLALVPTASLNWLNTWEKRDFEEKAHTKEAPTPKKGKATKKAAKSQEKSLADVFAAKVTPGFRSYLNPKVAVKLIKVFDLGTCSVAPSAHAAWVGYMPLKKGTYAVQQVGLTYLDKANTPTYNYQTFTGMVNQLALGGGLKVATNGNFTAALDYESQIGIGKQKPIMHAGVVKINWKW